MIETDDGYQPFRSCVLCGHTHAEKHRIIPGTWGGTYNEANLIELCPNHHVGIHYLMDWYLSSFLSPAKKKQKADKPTDEVRWEAYMQDKRLQSLWAHVVKPTVIAKLVADGLWHPHIKCVFNPLIIHYRFSDRERFVEQDLP